MNEEYLWYLAANPEKDWMNYDEDTTDYPEFLDDICDDGEGGIYE